MKKQAVAADPDAYVAALTGWRRECVEGLRRGVVKCAGLEEVIKWGHLVYFAGGPVLLIRAEEERVLLGFWRGQKLTSTEPRLKAGGKYEMATLELREGMMIAGATVRRLVREAVSLNAALGDPTKVVKKKTRGKAAGKKKVAVKKKVAGRKTTAKKKSGGKSKGAKR